MVICSGLLRFRNVSERERAEQWKSPGVYVRNSSRVLNVRYLGRLHPVTRATYGRLLSRGFTECVKGYLPSASSTSIE